MSRTKRSVVALASLLLALTGTGLAAGPAQAQHDWGLVPIHPPAAQRSWDPGLVQPNGPVPARTKADKKITTKSTVTKKAPPTGGPTTLLGTPYWYAGGQQNTSAISPAVTAAAANYTGWGSTHYLDSTNDSHTLVEHAVRKTNNSNAGLVEAGITKDPNLYADAQPRLFVAAWDKFGACLCYNTGFTLYASRTYSPGDVITSTKTFNWQYDAAGNAWWLGVGGTWVGYYDNVTTWPSFTFTSAGQVLGFGEIAQKASGTRTFSCSDMGTGQDSSSASAASVGSMTYNGAGTNVSMSAFPASGSNFTTTLLSARTYRYGGMGTNSTGGNPGNIGSC